MECGELELESSKGGPKTVPLAATIFPLRETLVLVPKSKYATPVAERAFAASGREIHLVEPASGKECLNLCAAP